MPAQFLIGLLAGLTSVVLYLGSSTGSLLGLSLALLAPLPVFIAGLGWGTRAALTAGLAASLVLTVLGALLPPQMGGWALGPAYLVTIGSAPIWLTRLTLLRRASAVPGGPEHEWFPSGHILLWIAGLVATALLIATALAYRVDPHGLAGLTKLKIDLIISEEGGLRQALLDETNTKNWETLSRYMAQTVPATAGIVWQLVMVVNGLIAHSILVAARHNIRPSIDWRTLRFPKLTAALLLGCLTLAFVGGAPGFIGGTLAAVLCVPYFFLGLTVVHAIPARGVGRIVMLGLVYSLLLVLISPAILIGILGLLEQWTGFRARLFAATRREDD